MPKEKIEHLTMENSIDVRKVKLVIQSLRTYASCDGVLWAILDTASRYVEKLEVELIKKEKEIIK